MVSLVPSAELIKYIEEVDKNGDGEIDFEEFQAMMAKV
jgi:Ca2+-binding EF-hand superfamily protein